MLPEPLELLELEDVDEEVEEEAEACLETLVVEETLVEDGAIEELLLGATELLDGTVEDEAIVEVKAVVVVSSSSSSSLSSSHIS